jgi:hypothetical protein
MKKGVVVNMSDFPRFPPEAPSTHQRLIDATKQIRQAGCDFLIASHEALEQHDLDELLNLRQRLEALIVELSAHSLSIMACAERLARRDGNDAA